MLYSDKFSPLYKNNYILVEFDKRVVFVYIILQYSLVVLNFFYLFTDAASTLAALTKNTVSISFNRTVFVVAGHIITRKHRHCVLSLVFILQTSQFAGRIQLCPRKMANRILGASASLLKSFGRLSLTSPASAICPQTLVRSQVPAVSAVRHTSFFNKRTYFILTSKRCPQCPAPSRSHLPGARHMRLS